MIKQISEKLQNNTLTRNSAPKLLSLLFALLLWIYVMDVENPEMTKVIRNIDIQVAGSEQLEASSLVLLKEEFDKVDVVVRGRRSDVDNVDRSDINITLNVNGLKEGTHEVILDKEISADNVIITSTSHRTVEVMLDKLSEQLKPVEIKFKGTLRPGYVADAATPEPAMVLVKGPEQYVNTVKKLIGEVDVASLKEKADVQIPIKAVDETGKVVPEVQVITKAVKASLGLLKVKMMTVTPNLGGNLPLGFELIDAKVTPSTVNIKGSEELLNAITELKTKPIDLSAIDKSQIVSVELALPQGVTAPDLKSVLKADIQIEAIKSKEIVLKTEDIEFFNIPAGKTPKLAEDLKVQIRGRMSLVDALQKEDLKVNIDLKETIQNKLTASVAYYYDNKFNGIKITPEKVEVNIVEE